MPLIATPTDAALAELSNSTVRVQGGAGCLVRRHGGPHVIATAHHVVRDTRRPQVSWPGGAGPVDVLYEDPAADIAILSHRPEQGGAGLQLVEPERHVAVGDSIWTAGFPQGWQDRTPVLSTGIIAGVGEETWLNLVGTWGNSGGAVAVKTGDGLRVVGLVTGLGSQVHEDLNRAVGDLRNVQQQLLAAFSGSGRAVIVGIDFGGFARFMAHAVETVCRLIEVHFRSGYVRVAPLDALRRALGG